MTLPVFTVFVLDGDTASCEAVRQLVCTMNLPCEIYNSGQEFLNAYDDSRRGCLITELRVPEVSGMQVQRTLRGRGSRLPVIFLVSRADVSIAVETLRNGAIHFLEKPFRAHELWNAIQEAIDFDQEWREERDCQQALDRRTSGLTTREREVLESLGQGRSSHDIATAMGVSTRTVEMHRARLMQKLEVTSLRELMQIAILLNEIKTEEPGVTPWGG